jgi:hypothetical protein
LQRVEVAVLDEDAPVIREIARRLTHGGAEALELRARYRPGAAEIRTGADLLQFLQASPLGEVELDFGRDRSLGRDIELP